MCTEGDLREGWWHGGTMADTRVRWAPARKARGEKFVL